ncbi:MAG: hypothetical protein JWO13_2094 [Acidobacteriales bacterium]|nr:hypothetical protein [Terriglobales bacterium]
MRNQSSAAIRWEEEEEWKPGFRVHSSVAPPGLLMRLHWYVSPRYWKQGAAALTVYASVFMIWEYLVR